MTDPENYADVGDYVCPICNGEGQTYIYMTKKQWEEEQTLKNADKTYSYLDGGGPEEDNVEFLGDNVIVGPFRCDPCKGRGFSRITDFGNVKVMIQG